MAVDYIIQSIQLKRANAATWTSVNPILLDGEAGYERDTEKLKIGDGVTPWNSLSYIDSVANLGQLSDVNTATPTNKNFLIADGTDWESRAAVLADISDYSATKIQDDLSALIGHTRWTLTEVPAGGSVGQVLKKNSGTNYDYTWGNPTTFGGDSGDIPHVPSGNIVATDVEAAIAELDAEKAPLSHTHVEADITDLQSYLLNIVEDTTPQLGGSLDAQGNDITDLGDVTFTTGATGGTLRTGTSNADKFELQAYDVNDGVYRKVLEVDAGNDVQLEVFADSFAIWDNTDETKQLFFTLSGAATSTTTELIFVETANRQITFPDASGTLSLVGHTHTESDITDLQSYLLPGDNISTLTNDSGFLTSSIGSNITPTANNTYLLGNASFRWATVYGVTGNFSGSIYTPGSVTADSSITTGAFRVVPTDVPPSTPPEGQIYADDSENKPKYYNGTSWLGFLLEGDAPTSHNHDTADITSGTFADARIAQSNITQHQAALSITQSQISDLSHVVDVVSNVATSTILGRVTAGSGDSEELTAAQVRTLINVEDGATADQTSIVGITGTKAEFDTAVTDGNIVYVGDTPSSLVLTNATGLPSTGVIDLVGVGSITAIPLAHVGGYYGNMSSANSTTTYTTTGTTIGAFAVIRINAASQPTVTGGTLLPGATFVADTDMHMVVQYYGTSVQYYFLALS